MQQRYLIKDEESSDPTSQQRHQNTVALYQRYAPALFEYLKRHTTTLHDAEDLLTEVFISALQHDLSLFSEDAQRAWLWTVARNKFSDIYRQRHRHPQISLEGLVETLADGATPEHLTLQQEEITALYNYLQHLSPIQQEVLQLRFIGGLRCTEIAVILHKREGSIRSLLWRALNGLRKYYEQ